MKIKSLIPMQVSIGPERVVTVDTLRGSVRPVIISGSRGQVLRSIKSAAAYIEALRERGVSIIPVILSDEDPSDKLAALKSEFRYGTLKF